MKDLLEAGVHFGHQTKRWNPKMKAYIFGERNGIYILDLGKTVKLFREAEEFVSKLAAEGRTILFVGTKRQAQDVIAEEAQRCGMYYVNERWLGGLLTNFSTIQRSLGRLRDLETMVTDGRYDTLSKKEIARNDKERRKLQKNLEGIRGMARLPEAVFVVDTKKEKIAVDEARKLKIPVLGIVDTNCDPDEVDFVIPGNDDALRSIRLFASRIADAVMEGRGMKESADVESNRESSGGAGGDDIGRRRRTTPASGPPRPRSGSGLRVDRAHDFPRVFAPASAGPAFSRTTTRPGDRQMAVTITASQVKKLRDQTGAGMMECKAALIEANGDFEEANTILRKRGLASAAKKAGRATSEGLIGRSLSDDHSQGILVEVNCESDFVARTDDFQQLIKDVARRHRGGRRPGDRGVAQRSRRSDHRARGGRHRARWARTWPCRASCATPGRATSASTSTWAARSACRSNSAASRRRLPRATNSRRW